MSNYYTQNAEILSACVQFFMIRLLRLQTVEGLEMLKFGDFIFQENFESFQLSQRLQNYLR